MRTAPRPLFVLLPLVAPLALAHAGELTVTAVTSLATAPWTETLSIPRFDPSLGTLESVRLELRATLRGRVAYENLAATSASATIASQALLQASTSPPSPASLDVSPVAPVSIQTQPFDGADDQAGPSGGVIANMLGQRSSTRTITGNGLPLFVGAGDLVFSIGASNTSAQLGGSPLAFQARATVSAELVVTYHYLPPADCDDDGTPDAGEPDADGDGVPDDCDREAAAYARPASLLVFPEFDSRQGTTSLITVTNTSSTSAVRARYVYIDGATCLEFNRTELLAAGDTHTSLSSSHHVQQVRGYLYVYAVDAGAQPIAQDVLVGSMILIDGVGGWAYGMNAIGMRAGPGVTLTNVDGDDLRDLNGIEYERVPDELLFARFVGTNAAREADLVLINLSGGAPFTCVVQLLVRNDNAQVFSAQHSFTCWTKTPLSAISGAFTNAFLHNATLHDPDEILGAPNEESGWFQLDGVSSNSVNLLQSDPAILGVLVERNGNGAACELPFHLGEQSNGDLVLTSPLGDTSGG